MVQATKNFEWMRLWPVVLGILFVGGAYNKVLTTHATYEALMGEEHKAIYAYVNSQDEYQNIKIDFSYARATEGHRYTWENSIKDAQEYNNYKSDMKVRIDGLYDLAHSASRFTKQGERLERRLDKCEARLNNGK